MNVYIDEPNPATHTTWVNNQPRFTGLDSLNIRDHGDAREKGIWPKVANTLAAYESFWRTLIVLLTNRIVPDIPPDAPDWIRLRPTVPCAYERLATHDYSLFYFAATARQAIDDDRNCFESGSHPHPERAFSALFAATEHAKKLRHSASEILCGLGIHPNFPKHPERLYRTIRSYRRALTHDPVLGRATDHGRELLPPEERLPNSDKTFLLSREIATIPASDMVDGFKLQDELWQELAAFLQGQWTALTKAFMEARQSDKFLTDLGLNNCPRSP